MLPLCADHTQSRVQINVKLRLTVKVLLFVSFHWNMYILFRCRKANMSTIVSSRVLSRLLFIYNANYTENNHKLKFTLILVRHFSSIFFLIPYVQRLCTEIMVATEKIAHANLKIVWRQLNNVVTCTTCAKKIQVHSYINILWGENIAPA